MGVYAGPEPLPPMEASLVEHFQCSCTSPPTRCSPEITHCHRTLPDGGGAGQGEGQEDEGKGTACNGVIGMKTVT